jgi:hypothetical protein
MKSLSFLSSMGATSVDRMRGDGKKRARGPHKNVGGPLTPHDK